MHCPQSDAAQNLILTATQLCPEVLTAVRDVSRGEHCSAQRSDSAELCTR